MSRLLAPALLSVLALAGCGGSADAPGAARTQPPVTTPPAERGSLELPARVPLRATGSADPEHAAVIRAWSDALRHGDVHAASALWAIPAKVQNGTPVLMLASRTDVLVFNASLPCGSVVTAAGRAKGFTITTFRLTGRKGGDCDAAAGAKARTAIAVREGKIAEWYRLPDDPHAPRPQPGAPDDVESTTI